MTIQSELWEKGAILSCCAGIALGIGTSADSHHHNSISAGMELVLAAIPIAGAAICGRFNYHSSSFIPQMNYDSRVGTEYSNWRKENPDASEQERTDAHNSIEEKNKVQLKYEIHKEAREQMIIGAIYGASTYVLGTGLGHLLAQALDNFK